jgi:hypothetical protein
MLFFTYLAMQMNMMLTNPQSEFPLRYHFLLCHPIEKPMHWGYLFILSLSESAMHTFSNDGKGLFNP